MIANYSTCRFCDQPIHFAMSAPAGARVNGLGQQYRLADLWHVRPPISPVESFSQLMKTKDDGYFPGRIIHIPLCLPCIRSAQAGDLKISIDPPSAQSAA